jgi:hypothetical protein
MEIGSKNSSLHKLQVLRILSRFLLLTPQWPDPLFAFFITFLDKFSLLAAQDFFVAKVKSWLGRLLFSSPSSTINHLPNLSVF